MMKSLSRLSLPILLACMFAAALPAQDAAQKQAPESKPPAELVVCTAPRRRWYWRPDTGPEWTASRIPFTSRR